ncbi:MAG: ABC transporter substrate-binding protein [Acidobacteriia bacterium]|nr:ABC transporter substrate-binding protein [Terriglobia bacterium]
MPETIKRTALCALAGLALAAAFCSPAVGQDDMLRPPAETGRQGGRLVVAQSSEPKTLNPVTALDQPSRDVIRRLTADLVHIERDSQKTVPALAKSWTATRDGKSLTVQLRRGLRFSDGAPFDADDVVFSYKLYLDEKIHSPQRDLLIVAGQPMRVEKLGPYSVRFSFAAPYAVAERVFDSLAILPRHLLEKDYQEGGIAKAWTLATSPDKIAGLGPFRLKQVVPGERIVLERNPYYWRKDAKGQKLPYLDELVFLTVPSRDAQVARFQAGETQAISPLSAENFAALEPEQQARHYKLFDVGPGMEYNFLLFNLNAGLESKLPVVARRQKWFLDPRFRQAVSAAVDRAALLRLVYRNRGAALATNVTGGNKLWINSALKPTEHSEAAARKLLQAAGFSWNRDGGLLDSSGQAVEFSILVSSSNVQRSQMATLIQDDLKKLGMNVHVVGLEFRSMVDRVLQSHDYETAVMGLGSGDADPNSDMSFLLSSGQSHLWSLDEKQPATPWEAEIDKLMQQQLVTVNYRQRKKLYDRVQEVMAAEMPVVFLASPSILVGAYQDLGNVRPAIIDNYILWNADELFWHTPTGKH